MILCLGTTPAVQRVMVFRKLAVDAVNRASTTLEGVAGKSVNVAKVLRVLGEDPIATGFLGGDRGEWIRSVLISKGVTTDFVPVQTRTRECMTLIDQEAGTVTELVEESGPVTSAEFDQLIGTVRLRLKACRGVVMSGTITPGGPVDLYLRCVEAARASGAMSVVDAQGTALLEALKARPELVKPNLAELANTIGRELKGEGNVLEAMRELHTRGAQRVVVTAGKNPCLAFDGHRFWKARSPSIVAVNPIGSGDAFTAALTWRLLKGDDLGESCRWAAAAGAANALTLMAGEVNREDVERLSSKTVVEQLS